MNFDVRKRTDQARIAVKHDDTITLCPTGQLKSKPSRFVTGMLHCLWFCVVVVIVIVIVIMVVTMSRITCVLSL